MKTPHKHAELIKAWADGAQIEYWSKTYEVWAETHDPAWVEADNYRIKPEPKPDIISYIYASEGKWLRFCEEQYNEHNLKITFDGETGKPKAVEVIA